MIRDVNIVGSTFFVSSTQMPIYAIGENQVRYNNRKNALEQWVASNNSWQEIAGAVDIRINPEIDALLNWVREKQQEEFKLTNIYKKYPELRKMKEQHDIMLALIKEYVDEPNR